MKHIPSGTIIVWLGNDNKVHSQSIPSNPMIKHLMGVKEYTTSEFLCHQLDYLCNDIASMPMITIGFTRRKAKEMLVKELQKGQPLLLTSAESSNRS